MGRPINKKYFGNLNIGTNGYTPVPHGNIGGDDGIGGEGFASVLFGAEQPDQYYSSGAYLNKMPHITAIGAPSIPGGVQAVADVSHVKAVHAVKNTAGTGYKIGDIVQGTTGTGTKARFKVVALRVLDVTVSNQPASSNFDGGENLVWDQYVLGNWTAPTILRGVVSTGTPNYDLGSGPHPYNVGASTYGVWDGRYGNTGGALTQAPTSLDIVGGGQPGTPPSTSPTYNTRGSSDTRNGVSGGSIDNNGTGGTVTFTYGIEEVELVEDYQGDYTAVDAAAQAVTNVTTSSGASATLDIFYGVKTITVTQKGSGYIGTETVTFTDRIALQNETRATGTIVLTTDSGAREAGTNHNVATNQDNAIIIHAKTTSGGTVKIGDIISQKGSNRYKVRTADGVAVVKLVANANPDVGEAYIKATDDNGSTYFVTRLTAHRALLTRWTEDDPYLFATNERAKWTFGNAQAGEYKSVKIENA
jgi:hypothetical protein